MTILYDFGMLMLLVLLVSIFIIIVILTNICVIVYQQWSNNEELESVRSLSILFLKDTNLKSNKLLNLFKLKFGGRAEIQGWMIL